MHTHAFAAMFRRILNSSMDLTWLGHACFRLRGREGVVLTDPPDPKSGAAIPKTAADLVTISNDDPRHNSLRSVGGEPVVLRGPGEYEVKEILVTGIGTFRDDEQGAKRGRNTIYAIRLDDLVICHLGGLGHVLPTADLEKLGDIDVALKKHMPARVRPPGVLASYSNYSAALAGLIIQNVSGIPYNDYIRRNIFDPLDMHHATFQEPLPTWAVKFPWQSRDPPCA